MEGLGPIEQPLAESNVNRYLRHPRSLQKQEKLLSSRYTLTLDPIPRRTLDEFFEYSNEEKQEKNW